MATQARAAVHPGKQQYMSQTQHKETSKQNKNSEKLEWSPQTRAIRYKAAKRFKTSNFPGLIGGTNSLQFTTCTMRNIQTNGIPMATTPEVVCSQCGHRWARKLCAQKTGAAHTDTRSQKQVNNTGPWSMTCQLHKLFHELSATVSQLQLSRIVYKHYFRSSRYITTATFSCT